MCPNHHINRAIPLLITCLLGSALDALSTGRNVVIILVHAASSAVSAGLRGLAAINILQLEVLNHSIGGGLGLLHAGRENLLQQLQVLQLVLLGELNLELDVQVAVVVVAERGHTLAGNNLDSIYKERIVSQINSHGRIPNRRNQHTRSDNLARSNVDGQPAVVKVLNVDSTTTESGQKVDLSLEEEVVALALETRVGLLLNLEDNITGENARHLVTLTTELDLVAIANTLVDVDVENLALNNGLLTVAALAAVLVTDDLALTVTVGADGLEALDHRTHLAHHSLHTATVTTGALLDSTVLATTAIAASTDNGLLQSKLGDLAAVDVLQVDLVHMVDSAGLLGASIAHATTEHSTEATTAAAEELREDILGVHSGTTSTAFQTLLTILVVDLTLLGIGKSLVGMRELLKLLRGLGVVSVLICMTNKMLASEEPLFSNPGAEP